MSTNGPLPSHPRRAPQQRLVGSPRRPRSTARILRRLDADWVRVRRRPDALHRAATWSDRADPGLRPTVDRLVRSITDLDQLVAATDRRRRSSDDRETGRRDDGADQLLRWLVGVGREDPLAARVVLHRVVGGVVSGCRPDLREGFEERLEVALANAWVSIRTFDVDRRRGAVAAAVISDATRTAREGIRPRAMVEIPRATEQFDLVPAPPPGRDPVVELARTVRSARTAGVAQTELDVLRELATSDRVADVADRRGVSTRMVRIRRGRAVEAVRRVLGDGWCPLEDAVA